MQIRVTSVVCLALLGAAADVPVARAAPGDQYVLPILRTQDGGANGFQAVPGAGFNGSTAVRHVTNAGQQNGGDIARIYWEFNSPNAPVEPRLYLIEWWDPTPGTDQLHFVEEQFRGSAGEVRPFDAQIPWNGSNSTNHMFLNTSAPAAGGGLFRFTTPGHAPDSAAPNAADDGVLMWLRQGSQLYVKWDFAVGAPIDRTYAELRLTQVVPEPAAASVALVLAGCAVRPGRRRRRM